MDKLYMRLSRLTGSSKEEFMKKKLLALFSCALIAAMAMFLPGCSEPSDAEQLEQYTSLASVSDFQSKTSGLLQELVTYSDPEAPDQYKAKEANNELQDICQAIIDEDNVPTRCEALHECYTNAASMLQTAGTAYQSAASLYSLGNYDEGMTEIELATTACESATSYLNDAGPMIAAMQE